MDLSTTYLGLNLRSPLIVGSASPLTENVDNIKRLEEAGASGIVLHSFFEEQLRVEQLELHHHLTYGTESFPEALTYFPEPKIFHVGAEEYLNHIRQAKEQVEIPIIASLNGVSTGGWLEYAKRIEEAGADALELNVYYLPNDFEMSGAQVEQNYVEILRIIKSEISIPVAMKLSPYFSNMANMAKQLADAGADGLVLFNRFYQPDIDLEHLEVIPNVLLSTPQAMRLPMHWIGMLYGRINVDFAAVSGIHSALDVIKMLMVGAKATMLVSVLLRHGIHEITKIELSLKHWLEEHEYESVKQLQGSMSQINCPDPTAFERVQYMKALQSYEPIRKRFKNTILKQ
ncbi:dihydroorotate dehydrogenase [Gloeothece citriformis PCC 7424]|uniref:Dihydroorotate dehydrogenase n=1 Tax=Gloeothece citriformis (strain PCC 7424) TaxID=65393 RepID=B7K7E1_GLOC7|nr:dihydroorotate dehydrogenase-like protein [Gloeothece citriformis]ACK69709.1 dihydroorotate dehydrogenase [Gloeothece citriformis PCC 7424]